MPVPCGPVAAAHRDDGVRTVSVAVRHDSGLWCAPGGSAEPGDGGPVQTAMEAPPGRVLGRPGAAQRCDLLHGFESAVGAVLDASRKAPSQ